MNRKLAWAAAMSAAAIFALGGCSDDGSQSASSGGTSATSNTAGVSTSVAASLRGQIPSPFTAGPQMSNTFLGAVDGTDAYIAVVMSGNAATAFICDGEQIWAWMDGTADNGNLDLTGADGAKLEGTVDGSTLSGLLTMAGETNAFQAAPPAPGEGVYRTVMNMDGQDFTLGWIMRSEGARGLMRSAGGESANGVNTNSGNNDQRRDRRERRDEQDRCSKLARDLTDAQATLAFVEAQPRVGGNIQMVVLNQQRVQRLIAAQC